jgi:hypothetical protein
LKEREAEIATLETNLAASHSDGLATPSLAANSPLSEVKEVKGEGGQITTHDLLLTPSTTSKFNDLKQSVLLGSEPQDAEQKEAESISRLDELMRYSNQK